MIERSIHGIAVAVIGLGGVVACDGGDPAPVVTSASPSGASGCARPAFGRADVTLTPGPTEGVPQATAGGDVLAIDAVVLDRGCQPVPGAPLRIWHTDARGLYGPKGGDDCCFYEARGQTDHSGRFRLETIRPAQYPEANAPPAHIHLQIDHGGRRAEVTMVFGSGSPPATVTPAEGPVGVLLSRDGAGWRGEAVLLLT
ncbi:dioxygenase family protein [Phytohabitans sp. LJ34]|uniref:dioxygenase family protein n=1 Tax=Phytohabitans sp. LJ34 TaxID=3452217 RepID=UPI003F8C9BF7